MADPKPELDPQIVEDAVVAVLDEVEANDAPMVRVDSGLGKRSWSEKLVRFLDDGLRVPFTDFRFGVDSILGFFLPVAGDTLTSAGTVALLLLALKERVPTKVLGKMLLNTGIDVVVGAFPVIGDAFDVVWRSNRKNLELIREHGRSASLLKKEEAEQSDATSIEAIQKLPAPKEKAPFRDYLLVGLGIVLAIVGIIAPIVVLYFIGSTLSEFFIQLFN